MDDPTGGMWIYFIFFLIPLVRIIPRLLRRMKNKNSAKPQASFFSQQFTHDTNDTIQGPSNDVSMQGHPDEIPTHRTNDMLVLGELNKGTKQFDKIQKNTNLDSNELESILDDLERQGLMRVEHKKGPFGSKIELHSTEKGFDKYYS